MSLFNSVTLNFTRYSSPQNIDGKLVNQPIGTITASGTLQPLKYEDLEDYPSLDTVEGVYRFYTTSKLNWEDDYPDTTLIEGERYQLFSRKLWKNNLINHNQYLLRRI